MREKELRKSMSVFPMSAVMQLTDLSARQIRYYEQQGLIKPERNEGNRRLFSLDDIDRLLEIKDYLADGLNIAGIKRVYTINQQKKSSVFKESPQLTDEDVRRILYKEFISESGFTTPDPFQSDLHNL